MSPPPCSDQQGSPPCVRLTVTRTHGDSWAMGAQRRSDAAHSMPTLASHGCADEVHSSAPTFRRVRELRRGPPPRPVECLRRHCATCRFHAPLSTPSLRSSCLDRSSVVMGPSRIWPGLLVRRSCGVGIGAGHLNVPRANLRPPQVFTTVSIPHDVPSACRVKPPEDGSPAVRGLWSRWSGRLKGRLFG